jgi:basic membrane lipoprotein Med (substrate-binding protein (PBP1-ABC) superfamily)
MSGCWNGPLLFSFEQPYWTSLGDDLQVRLALARVSIQHGFLPRFIIRGPQENPAAQLAQDVSAGPFRTVVVGPLLSFEWKGYVTQSPRTHFILVGADGAEDLPSNAVALVFDRANAFSAAGFAAGESVREGARGEVSGTLGTRIAILLTASSLTQAETEGFASGVAEALEGARPTVRVLEGTDRVAVKTAVQQMRAQGVEVFLLGMGSLDPWGLEVMRDAGGCAVVADWAASGAFPAQVFVSVEEDIPGGIARALSHAAPGTHAVSGPMRIVPGKARPVPKAAKLRVGGG